MRYKDLLEDFKLGKLSTNKGKTLPPVVVFPELNSGNNYPQYRFMTMMAAIRAINKGEVPNTELVPWATALSVTGYTKEEIETALMAAKATGFTPDMMQAKPSEEPDWVNKTSTVMKFNMTESMRSIIDKLLI